jgi:hypothetical protein
MFLQVSGLKAGRRAFPAAAGAASVIILRVWPTTTTGPTTTER